MPLSTGYAAFCVVLLAIFVPFVRGCGWRTAAVFTAVLAAILFMSTMLPWREEAVSDDAKTRSKLAPEHDEFARYLPGLCRPFLGGYVFFLGLFTCAAATRIAIAREPFRPSKGTRNLALLAAIGMALAFVLTATDLVLHDPAGPYFHGEPWGTGSAFGIYCALLASFFGAYCAGGLFVKILSARATSGKRAPTS